MKVIMTGDEAVARGAWEAGVTVAAAYPGTPSTEIMEALGTEYKQDVHAQWACNEKVALEIAVGASIGGARSLASMKHVGMNVAADPLFTAAYTGVNGGLVVVSADDPGFHSSQNEQDNRHYAKSAKLLLLEPSDSQECADFTRAAFELSERFDMVAMIRITTRVCHSKSLVELSERSDCGVKPYVRNPGKYAMLPANARVRHSALEAHLKEAAAYADTCPMNRAEWNDTAIGVITSGISYQHARDVFGDTVSYLKLGMTNPMPDNLIRDFCQKVDKIYIIEEGDPFLEDAVRRLGFDPLGKAVVPAEGELNAAIVRKAFLGIEPPEAPKVDAAAPARPPVLCAGCPHRGFYQALRKYAKKIVRCGDIGCYSLGVSAPMEGFDLAICMGGGFSTAIGMSYALAQQGDDRKVFGMLGDSTFFHSGMTGLVDIVHSDANVCACVLDNSITAMTGHQQNPGTPVDLMGQDAAPVAIEAVVRATGLPEERIRIVDPVDQAAMDEAVTAALAVTGPFVIISRRPCALLKDFIKANNGRHCVVNSDKCVGCRQCMSIACPAMSFRDGKAMVSDTASCTGCGLCMQMCRLGAIERIGG